MGTPLTASVLLLMKKRIELRLGTLGAPIREVCRAIWSFKVEAVLLSLVLLSLAAVRWQDNILRETITITPGGVPSYPGRAFSDEDADGASTAAADPLRPLKWQCALREGSPYPYCGYQLLFDPKRATGGVDLSDLESLTIAFRYEGPAKTIRLQLINHDPRYSEPGVIESNKFNVVDIPAKRGFQRHKTALEDFAVAEWWITGRRIPPHLSKPQFENIISLDVQTGSGAPLGVHRFEIESITLRKALITSSQLYLALLIAWMVIIGVIVAYRIWHLKRDLDAIRLLGAKALGQAEQAEKAVVERHIAQVAAEDSRRQLETLLDNLPGIAYRSSVEQPWTMTFVSEGVEDLTGYKPSDFQKGLTWGALIFRHDLPLVDEEISSAVAARRMFSITYRITDHSGSLRWVLERGRAVYGAGGEPLFLEGFIGDLTEQKHTERSLVKAQRAAEQNAGRVQKVLENTSDCVCALDREWQFTYLNQKAKDYFGERELVGRSIFDVFPGSRQSIFSKAFDEAMQHRRPASAEGYFEPTEAWYDLSVVPDDSGVTVFFRDITARKQSEERVRWLANHDSLTRLPNRLLFQERLDQLIARGEDHAKFALLVLDVDDFKQVNDTLGHDAGDELLCTFASRLRAAARSDDLVARLGGDEFAIILNGVGTHTEVEAAVDGLFVELRQPHLHDGKVLDCNASIGASIFPAHGKARAELLKHADIALYAAKASGRSNMQIFRPQMRSEMQARVSMLSLARSALADDSIIPFYQPKIDLHSGKVAGFEALLRLDDRQGGFQLPDAIAAAFEDLTLAADISDRIIDRVLADIVEWGRNGIDFGHVAINASAAEFRKGNFGERLLERLSRSSLPASTVQIEVTETVFLGRGASYVERALKTLSRGGVRIALDDFGTGYASLSHLKQFPVDILKIDRSFVRDVERDEDASAIIGAVVNLGKSLNIRTVAEGIETAEQAARLTAKGCDYGQGFFYSPAVPAAELPLLVTKNKKKRAA